MATYLCSIGVFSILFIGVFSILFIVHRSGVMPAGGNIVSNTDNTGVFDHDGLIGMFRHQITLANALISGRPGTCLDYYNKFSGILYHLNANLDYVRANHYDIEPKYSNAINNLST